MKCDLVEGYLFEVTKSLSRRDRKDIREKLEPEIYEKIEERKKGDIETKEEVLSVLKEYGTPQEVAMKYSSKKKGALIPEPHYSHYSRDKGFAYLIAVIAVILLSAFSYFSLNYFVLDLGDILVIANTVITSFIIIYIAYTIAFSLVSSSRIKNWHNFSKNLKAAPSSSGKAGIVGITFQIIISTLLFVLIGFGSKFLHFSFDRIQTSWGVTVFLLVPVALIFFFSVLNIAYKEIDRRYTFGVLLTTIIKDLGLIGLSYILFIKDNVITPEFKDNIFGMVAISNNNIVNTLIENLELVIFLLVVFFAVFGIVSTAFSYHEDKKESVEPMERGVIRPEEVIESETPEEERMEEDKPVEEEVVDEKPEIVDSGVVFEDERSEEDKQVVVDDVDEDLSDTRVIPKDDMKKEVKTEAEAEKEIAEVMEERENLKEHSISDGETRSIADAIRNANPDNK